ncbi:MAG: hypothetical protein ACK4OO_03550 [bacterium]
MDTHSPLEHLQAEIHKTIPYLEEFTAQMIKEVSALHMDLRTTPSSNTFNRLANLFDGLAILINLNFSIAAWRKTLQQCLNSEDNGDSSQKEHLSAGVDQSDSLIWDSLLAQMIEAQERADWIALADLLHYELLPLLSRCREQWQDWQCQVK